MVQPGRSANVLYCAAAAATAVAGVLHLMMGPGSLGFNAGQGILFTVGGIAQIFWIIPMVRRWGIPWYGTGIGGTAVFIAIWAITRVPGNPITGRGGPAGNPTGLATEIAQAIFIALAIAIIAYELRAKRTTGTPEKAPKKKKMIILVGIVIALVLIGAFVLPAVMPRGPMRGGSPPGQQGAPPGATADTQPAQQAGTVATTQTCTATPSLIEVEGTPQETEGPYFVDEKLDRSDIRPDPSDNSIQQGVPLTLTLNVYDVDSGTCLPLEGAQVDVWHANAAGLYSDIQQEGTEGKKFLRGYQVTNDNGTVRFTTVYPGWYEGRAMHIHMKVRTFDDSGSKTLEWTSQLYADDSISDAVYTQAPYSTHGPQGTKNSQDSIYTGPSTDGSVQSNTGRHLMLQLTKDGNGYTGTFNIGVKIAQSA